MTCLATGLAGRVAATTKIAELPRVLFAVSLAACVLSSTPARGGDAPRAAVPGAASAARTADSAAAAATADPRPSRKSSPYHSVSVPNGGRFYYLSIWGVDNLLVRQTASGNLIRFSYRVVDPVRAKLLGDKRATPYMYGERSHALLHIPVMEQVGPLRQSVEPKAGKEYWMVFSNKGNFVQVGDRVDVIIGDVHVDGMLVE